MSLQAVGCDALTPGAASPLPALALAPAGDATDVRLLDMGKRAPWTQANASSKSLRGLAVSGQKNAPAVAKKVMFGFF